jgi:hypothetical protein
VTLGLLRKEARLGADGSMKRRCRSGRIAARFVAVSIMAATPGGLPAGHAADRTIKVARRDCASIVEHVPAPDVAYQPGVDVSGRPVVPADLDGGWHVDLPELVLIDITRDVAGRFGLRPNSPLFAAEAFIGVVDIDLTDGRVRFNGTDLSGPEARALAALCREAVHPH